MYSYSGHQISYHGNQYKCILDLLKPDPQQANRFAGLEFDAGCTQLPSPVAPARLIPGAAAPGLGEGYDHVHSDEGEIKKN